MIVIISRESGLEPGAKQSIGTLIAFDENGGEVFNCKTLELPWKKNENRVSCIPVGSYNVHKRHSYESYSFGYDHFLIQNVSGRSYILIHAGNYYTHTAGCVLVGERLLDINYDGYKDVTNSRDTLAELLKVTPENFIIEIRNVVKIKT